MVSSVSPETEHTPAKVLTVSRESPPATAVRPGFEPTRRAHASAPTHRCEGCRSDRRARLRCQWVATGPGRASRRRTEQHVSDQTSQVRRAAEGLEGTGCGARERWRGLAGFRADAPSHTSATRRRRCGGCRRVRRARAGFEIDHSEPSGSRVAISRAGRRPPAHTAAKPTGRRSGARNTSGATSNTAPGTATPRQTYKKPTSASDVGLWWS